MLLFLLGVSLALTAGQVIFGPSFGVGMGLTTSAICIAFLVALKGGARVSPLCRSLLWWVFFSSVGIMIASGGKAISAVIIACLFPILGLMLEGPGRATRWAFYVLARLGLTAIYASTTDTYLFRGDLLA